jgi:hypothetical protein
MGVYISLLGGSSSDRSRASRSTPTTVIHGAGVAIGPCLMRCPIGSWAPNSRFAIVSLITATGGAPRRSWSVKPRPRRIDIPIAAK